MKGKTGTLRIYHGFYTGTVSSAASRYKFNASILDVKALLETLAGQGEEFKITKASLNVQLYKTDSTNLLSKMDVVAMVSDQSISNTDPGDNNSSSYLDDDLDVLTAGDYEAKKLGQITTKLIQDESGTKVIFGQISMDITKVLQQASALLARSAILSSNPYISIVGVGYSSATNISPSVNCFVEVHGAVRQKPLRMLA